MVEKEKMVEKCLAITAKMGRRKWISTVFRRYSRVNWTQGQVGYREKKGKECYCLSN